MGAVASKQPTRRDLAGINAFESSIKVMAYTKMTERRDVMQHRQDLIGDGFDLEGSVTETPMSRTHQYRKVMKPLLERKRKRKRTMKGKRKRNRKRERRRRRRRKRKRKRK